MCVEMNTKYNNLYYRTAVPQYPASPIFSLQINPLPADPNALVNNPILMMFDVVRQRMIKHLYVAKCHRK